MYYPTMFINTMLHVKGPDSQCIISSCFMFERLKWWSLSSFQVKRTGSVRVYRDHNEPSRIRFGLTEPNRLKWYVLRLVLGFLHFGNFDCQPGHLSLSLPVFRICRPYHTPPPSLSHRRRWLLTPSLPIVNSNILDSLFLFSFSLSVTVFSVEKANLYAVSFCSVNGEMLRLIWAWFALVLVWMKLAVMDLLHLLFMLKLKRQKHVAFLFNLYHFTN